MNKPAFFFIASCLVLFSFSCKKDREKIDLYSVPTTNRLVCKINGKKWETSEVSGGIYKRTVESYRYIYIWSWRGRENIDLYMTRPFETGIKYFTHETQSQFYTAYPRNYGFFHRHDGWGNSETYITNSMDTGYCRITFIDTLAGKIKGAFSFRARDPATNKVIYVTDGYFEKVGAW